MSFSRVFTIIAVALFIALSIIIGSITLSYTAIEKTEQDLTEHVVESHFNNMQDNLRTLVLDYSWWSDAFINITANWRKRDTTDWINRNIGTTDLLNGPIHGLAIIKNDGHLLYQKVKNDNITYQIAPDILTNKFAQLKQIALAYPEDKPEVILFNDKLDGQITYFAFSPITYYDEVDRPDFPADKRDFMLFWSILTTDVLAKKGHDLGLTDLRITTPSEPQNYPIRDMDGNVIASLTWTLNASISNPLTYALATSIFISLLLMGGGYMAYTEISGLITKLNSSIVKAERGHQIKSDFLATMSHELRTPLNAIIGFSDMLKSTGQDDLNSRQDEYIGHIQTSSRHLLTLINEILDMSKIEAGKYELNEEEINLKHSLNQAIVYLEKEAKDKNITLVRHIPSLLNEFLGDEKVIRQLILNLLSNAIKFTPEHGTVTIGCAVTNRGAMEIYVADNGVGISAEKLDIITEPYLQDQDHKTRSHQGTGLGLAISKAFVQMHQGIMQIESTLGKGTTVFLTFPPERVLPDMI